jgi:hypothetical protein
MRPLTLNTTDLLFECPADVAAFPDHELHLADGDLGRLMDDPEPVEAILEAISGPSALSAMLVLLVLCTNNIVPLVLLVQ